MDKISHVQLGEMLKTAGASITSLLEEKKGLQEQVEELESKVAHFEHKEKAEKIAHQMEEKNLQPELSFSEKVAGLVERENLEVVEEAVKLSAPQVKLASISDNGSLIVDEDDAAANTFAASLASL